MSRFLRVFAFVVGVFFAGNVLAGGYTCPTYKVYTGCNKGYYLTASPTSNVHDATQGKVGNACRPCSVMGQYNGVDKYTCAGGTAAPEKRTVMVQYNWNGAKYRPSEQIIPMPTETYDFGVPIDLLEDTENQYYRAGYQFRGWSTSQTATSGTFTMTFTSGTTLYAVWVPCGQGRYKPASATAAASCSSMSSGYYGTGCASDGYTACTGQAQCTGTTYCQDHIKQECPDPNLAKNRRETLPAAYKGAKFASAGVESANGRTEPGQCKALIWYDPDPNATGQRVGLFEYVFLSDATMRYEGDVENWMYDAVGPGYYLTNKSACGAYAYYKQVVACPDGSYCPGKAKVTCNASNQSTVHTTDFGRMSCPGEYTHSDGARSSINNCYLTTTTGKYVATAKDGQVACNVTDPTDYYYPGGIKVYYGSTGGWKFMDTGYQNAALSGGSCANKELCPAGTWGDSAGLCSPVDAGYYPNDCQVTYLDDRPGIGCMTMESCSSLPGSPSTGTFKSPEGAKSNRECTYTPVGKSIAGCATVTPITVTYTGQSWPANVGAYAVTPKTGYVAKNNNTATATCVQEIYTIKLNATQNGGTGTLDAIYEKYNTGWYSDSVTNVSISSVPIPTKANSVFNGYYTAATGGTQRITKTGELPAPTFTASTTLYAQFSACAACTKGKGVKSCSASVTDNACAYSATCSNGYKNPTCDSAGKCSCTGNTFYIEYNAYGGSGPAPTAPKSCVVGSGNCYAPENTYSLTGHTFFAWRVGGQQIVRVGTELSNLFTGMADGGTLTLMAAWVPNSYTIRYTMGDAGESEYREQNVNYNATFTTMSADTFTRSGWTFAGWGGNYPKSDTQYSYTTAGDTILAANWCQNCATVPNGSCTLTVNETTGACTYDTKCNTGYYISSGAGTRAPVCSPSSYVVTYNLNGGSGTAPLAQSCPLGQSCTLNAGTTTAFYRNGYVLAGWSTSQTATSGSFTITITAATTVYAVWTPCAAGTYKPTTANAAATCTTCPAGTYCPAAATTATKCPNWTYASSSGMASCTACPTLTSGWSKANSTGTGWTSYTSCVQISPTPAGCASGNVKQTAASNGATTWAASVVNTALSANPGYRVNGTSCSICTGATYSAGGTATSCSTCPTIYQSDTTSGKTKDTECKVKTDAGKYIKTAKDSVQTTCPIQTYCPSASVAYGSANSPTACPSAAEHARTTYPADYLNPTLLRITLQDWTTGMKTITDCRANYQLSNEAGNLTVESVLYNATTQKYDVNGSRYYTVLKPGWYFTERYSAVYCDTASHSMLYKNVAQCPENHYCPGYTTMPLCKDGDYTTEKGKFACGSENTDGGENTGPYTKSPAKSTAATACYLTTTSTKFVKTAKSAQETCTAGGYCPGGVKVNWGSTGGRTPASAGYYVGGTGATSQTACAAGTYTSTTGQTSCSSAVAGTYTTGCQVTASGASTKTLACTGTSVCATNTYSSAKASACTACATAKGYTNSGNTAAAHAGLASCKTTCSGGQYVATAGAGCLTVGGGYYGPGGTIGQDGTLGRDQCPAGYRDGAAAAAKTDCKMNVAGGKYIATADDATPTSCVAGTFKAAHVVAYGNTSSCSACTGRTQYSSAGASSCSTVSTGYYTTGCNASNNNCTGQSQCTGATYCASGVQNNCPAQTSGWTRGTGNGWTSYTSCYETMDVTSVSRFCSAGQLKKTATSATAWGAPTISVALQAKPGTIVNGQTCELCSGANYSAGGTATSCTACPTAETGWTQGTGDAWSSYSSCYETKAATSVSTSCSAGQLKKTATSATAWGASTISVALQAKPGAVVSGQTCTQCSGAVWSAGGTATSCSACPTATSGWTRNSGTGWTAVTQCNQTKSVGGNCSAGVLKQNATSATAWGTSTIATALQAKPGYVVSGQTCTGCAAGTYSAGGTATSCSACTGRTKYSAANASACSTVSTGYYTTGCNTSNNNCTGQSQCGSGTWCASGVQNQCSSLTGVSVSGGTYSSAVGSSANTACKYTAPSKTITGCATVTTNTVTYSGTAWPATTYGVTAKGGYVISGNNTAAATCTQCGTAKYSAGGTATSCSACPTADSGWTATSPAGSSAYTACYETQTPANCASGTVKRAAASATAYKTDITLVTQLKSKAGYYASATATSCTICPAGSYCPASATTATKCPNWTYAPSSGMASCTACPALTSGWTKANSTGTGWTSYTSCVQISPTPAGCASGNVKQTAASNGATTWATSVVNTALSAKAGYVVSGTTCPICTGATYSAGGTATSCSACPTIYQSDTTSGKTKNTECKVKTDAGKYIAAANDSTQTTCPAKNYCPSASVAYGSANSPTACPAADSTTERTTYPDDYLNVKERGHFGLQSWPSGIKAITGCMTSYSFVNEAGRFGVENVGYNTTTGKYDVGGSRYYTMLNPGWYLKDRLSSGYCNTTSNPMYYVNVVQCPENHYCPGYKTMPLCSSGEYTTEKGKNACSSLGTGVYTKSPVKSGAETACYLTTTSAKFVKTAKSAEETCTAGGYCPGGVKVNWGSTGGRNTCPTTYPSSAASSNSELDCYVTTVAGKYVATVGAGQVNCAGTGYYCPGGTNVYSGAYGSRLTTGGRTQCPVGYRDLVATASTTKEAQCAMNVAGGKYVKVAKESAASGTCAAGYAKAAHSVTYGNTSSCAECTGTTYAENTGQASCTACPTQSGVTNISYWISTGTHTDAKGCYGFYNDVALNNGSVARIQCFWDKTKSQYDTSCGAMKDGLKCNAAYYNAALESSPTNNAAYYTDKASVIAKACTSVGKGYWSPADVYTRTQCPAGYRDGAAGVSEAQCAMNVAGGKYVKVAKESAASGTCAAGYAKAAHSVTYGNTSSCAACTGATYAASTGQASCTACPTAKTYASAVKSYGYWNNGKNGDHTISDGCYATMTGTLSNGSLTEHGCYLGTDGDYGNGGGKSCYVHQDNLKCNAGYYASTLSNGYVWNNTRAGLLSNTCVGVGAGYYSAANILTRNQCPTGLTTIGYGAGADEAGDCGRVMHMGENKLYLRSTKKTTPSLNVKVGDTTYYGNMTSGTTKGKLRVKSGTTTYSVHDDSM